MKRIFDLVTAAVALVLVAPLLLVLAILVWRKIGRPVLFTQERAGLHGETFRIVKFRSMTNARDDDGKLLPDADRLGRFGRWLRATSLDELPELVNVLRGEMSLVGPRPLLVEYLPLYDREQARRHEVRPGLTGWAQIHGRNATSWDVWYVDNRSCRLDLKILWRTLRVVFDRESVNAEGHVTMPRFEGSNRAEAENQ